MGSGPGVSCAVTLNTSLTPEQRARYQDVAQINNLLNASKTIAIVGLSSDRQKASFFNAVSCPTATSCVAVGVSTLGAKTHQFAETWNGSKWRIVSMPARSDSGMNAVSCPVPSSADVVNTAPPSVGLQRSLRKLTQDK